MDGASNVAYFHMHREISSAEPCPGRPCDLNSLGLFPTLSHSLGSIVRHSE
jgi:hypothetical protein